MEEEEGGGKGRLASSEFRSIAKCFKADRHKEGAYVVLPSDWL